MTEKKDQPATKKTDKHASAEERIAAAGEALDTAADAASESEAAQTALKDHDPKALEAAKAQQHADDLAEKLDEKP